MKNILCLFILIIIGSCNSKQDNYLVRFYLGDPHELGTPFGYLNEKGDTIIPANTYYHSYTDTIRDIGMVFKDGKIFAINKTNTKLFEVFRLDYEPDEVQNGLFRIVENGKIGYADTLGNIIIKPRFKCAFPFNGERAKVSDSCTTIKDSEHSVWKSEHWYYISKQGKRVEK